MPTTSRSARKPCSSSWSTTPKTATRSAPTSKKICPELIGGVLVIHTKRNGDISEASSGKDKEELEKLRRQSNEIDSWKSPFKAIVSVLMLKEGWGVRNVTTMSACAPTQPSPTSSPSKPSGAVCAACISVPTRRRPSPSWARSRS